MIDVEGLKWEASNGSYTACSTLAEAFFLGKEIEEDNDKAFYWFQQALKYDESNRDAVLLYRVAQCHFHGYGTIKDEANAYKYFRRAAILGNTAARFYTGWCLVMGRGVETDVESGLQFLENAAYAGNDDALTMLIQLYDGSDYVAADDVKYLKYLKMGVDRNVPMALSDWGLCLTSGDKGVAINMEEGINVLKKASDLGRAIASKNLGIIYGFGEGMPIDREIGEKYLRRALEQGDETAITTLGLMYIDMAKELLVVDNQESFDKAGLLLKKAINEGFDAYGELGELYLFGYLKDPNRDHIDKAIELFDMSTGEGRSEVYAKMSEDLKRYRNDYNHLRGLLNMYISFFARQINSDPNIEWVKYRNRMSQHGIIV